MTGQVSSPHLEQLAAEAQVYAGAARAGNTIKAYESDWADFANWCASHEIACLPAAPETVALYLTELARLRRASTLSRRLAAITHVHRHAGELSPSDSVAVRTVLSGIRRIKGTARRRKKPLLGKSVAEAAAGLGGDLLGLRNRALLLIGYAGALRRSELVALNWDDAAFTPDGLKLTVRQSKTDQAGQGTTIGIPFGSQPWSCPVAALEVWRQASSSGGDGGGGAMFRVIGRAGKTMDERLSHKAVARLVKQVAARLGLDPREFSGHSLRAGLATTAAANGASERKIMDQTRHRSLTSVRVYVRDGELFRDNAAARGEL